MDFIRSAYRTEMDFGEGQSGEIKWFFADPDAELFPGLHRFGSLNWLPEAIPDAGPGEILDAPRTWVNGSVPVTPAGIHPDGPLEDFLTGNDLVHHEPLRLNRQGMPRECAPLLVPDAGGVELEGHAPTFTRSFLGSGGLELGGDAVLSHRAPLYPVGGADLGGAVPSTGVKHVQQGSGGAELGGQARIYRPAGILTSCGNCTVMMSQYKVKTVGGYANNGCANCASLNNGTWTVTYVSGCLWASAPFTAICSTGLPSGTVQWFMYYQGGIGWRLELDNAAIPLVIFDPISLANFQCLGLNTWVNPSWNPATCASSTAATTEPIFPP